METDGVSGELNLNKGTSIDDLPEEVLEFILTLVSPYKDLEDCMQVSQRWRRCALNVAKANKRNFEKAINDFDVIWKTVTTDSKAPSITKRYSHTAVVCDNSMYVFGGCTSAMTTFNDLWRLDLSTRKWVRPLAMGTYPSPKACSSLIRYKDFLVLFGGWTYPASYPLYQSWHLFDELHVYDIVANRWTCISTISSPPPVAGHSVSVVGEWMIVFGGLQKPQHAIHCEQTNDIWRLHLETWTWYRQEVQGPKPYGRFGQTQVVLDDKHLLILGGSGGPSHQYSDCWVLNMEGTIWRWKEVKVEGKPNEPAHIWSNPGCKIGDKIVLLNRVRETEDCPWIVYYPRSQWNQAPEDGRLSRIDLANRQPDIDKNVNGRRGVLRKKDDPPPPSPPPRRVPNANAVSPQLNPAMPNMVAFMEDRELGILQRNRNIDNNLRLERLQWLGDKLDKKATISIKKEKRFHRMSTYVLDISEVQSEHPVVTWLPAKKINPGPEEAIFYSLVAGKTELIMFGGILKVGDYLTPCNFASQISSSLHFISAPNYVI